MSSKNISSRDELTETDSAVAGKKFVLSSFKEHVKKKGMWAGSLSRIDIPDLKGLENVTDGIIDIKATHTPALIKAIEELIVNATDHAKSHETLPQRQRVTLISTTFDLKTGKITIYNDGPGIPVVLHTDASTQVGYDVYMPEIAFSYFLAGTNIDKELTNVKGGINGFGAKLANVHSTELTIETVDSGTKRFYTQQWRNRLDIREDPKIIDLHKPHTLSSDKVKQHTEVSIIPAYVELGYSYPLSISDAHDIDIWLRLRMHQAAAYIGSNVLVTYCGVTCSTTDATLLGRMILGEASLTAIVLSSSLKATVEPYKQHPWHIAIIVLPVGKKTDRSASSQNMTIINGVISNKGSHIKYIKDMISTSVEEKLCKAMKKKTASTERKMSITETLSGVRLVICGALPGADWSGQRKDELQVPKETLENYKLAAAFLKIVGDTIAERILLSQDKKLGKVIHDKYTKARYAGKTAYKSNTYLLAAEGDSAITFLRAGLTQTRKAIPAGGPSLDWNGIISLQGVIVNAAREVTSMETLDGEEINVRSSKLQSNKRLLALADAFGLQYNYTYTTPQELATLNYGLLILCVDQDLDGTGKIAALVLVWIYLFWPALIASGRVGRFMTPLVRAYPTRGLPVEFYYEEELKIWLAADDTRSSTHNIKYYKGLATHDTNEVKRMFTVDAFKHSIYIYTMDETAKRLFEVYFGVDPALRKEALITPIMHLSIDKMFEYHKSQIIPVGRVQLDIDTKSYKNDAIKRQISGGCDGQNPARRKILMGAMLRSKESDEVKIFQLGGYVANKCFYHHGDMSLNSTIVYMAQAYPGARKYPYLIGVGQFGSRHGDKAGSARYISVKLSPIVKVIFPPEDRWHLQYIFEDGKRAEPLSFIPVVPMAALESYKIVSEGWNHNSFGRDLNAVLKVVDAYISGDTELTAAADRLHTDGASAMPEIERLAKKWILPVNTNGFDGEIRSYRGEDYSFGMYSWNEKSRTITVTELPMGMATSKYIEILTKPCTNGNPNPRDEFIEHGVLDRSSVDKVELEIILKVGAFAKISAKYGNEFIDPIEDILMLRSSLRPHLNYYSVKGAVLEFGECYLALILYWAPLRRNLYLERLTRELIITELRILEEEQIIRYIGIAAELDLAKQVDDDTAFEILKIRGFPLINHSLLHRPEYILNVNAHSLITTGSGASFDYLLNLRERDLIQNSVIKRMKVLKTLYEQLAIVKQQLSEPLAGASVWRAEIEKFKLVV